MKWLSELSKCKHEYFELIKIFVPEHDDVFGRVIYAHYQYKRDEYQFCKICGELKP